jgi:DNA-directed RNA polymerase subunit H (RpoH/RPB5)
MNLVRSLPKASPEYDFFCAFIGVMEILKARGYLINKAYNEYIDRNKSLKDRFEKYLENLEKDEEKEKSKKASKKTIKKTTPYVPYDEDFELDDSVSIKHNTYPSKLKVCILNSLSHARHVFNIYAELFKLKDRGDNPNILVVYNVPKDENKTDPGNASIEVMCYQQVLLNPIYHSRAPIGVTKLSRSEKKQLLDRRVMEGKKLVTISRIDPISLFMDAKKGDVIKYIDAKVYTEQGLSTVEYKMVG